MFASAAACRRRKPASRPRVARSTNCNAGRRSADEMNFIAPKARGASPTRRCATGWCTAAGQTTPMKASLNVSF